jgi:hypothetical protein
MSRQLEIATTQHRSRQQMLLAWLTAWGKALDFDSQAYAETSVVRLRETVAQLETRLNALEGDDQCVSTSPVSKLAGRR